MLCLPMIDDLEVIMFDFREDMWSVIGIWM